MNTIKIILADDHKIVRDGIKALLKLEPSFEIIGEADNGKQLLDLLDETLPDVILTDINMPGMNGIEALSSAKKINPNLRIMVLTMHQEPDYIVKAMQGGANGYLLKNVEFDELRKAILTIHDGRKYFPPDILSAMVDYLPVQDQNKEETSELSQREIEVLKEVANGMSNKQIADILKISSRTVEGHRVNIMKKLGVHNSAEMIKKAMQMKLL